MILIDYPCASDAILATGCPISYCPQLYESDAYPPPALPPPYGLCHLHITLPIML
jgi:hypothetical protein